jgi:perosamine synthetase
MTFIPVNEPLLDGNEKKYLAECIDSGWISSEGPFVKKFEDAIALMAGRTYGVAVSNGTAAIDAAIQALDIGVGDEVILPAFTIISCVNQIIRAGAIPVLVDCDPLTWNMDVSSIELKVTKKTKAILVAHIYGLPVDMNPVLEVCKKYHLKLIEDAAEAHGQKYFDRPCGSFGDISTFSFYSNKHITTGEGGMVLTDNSLLAERLGDLRNLYMQPQRRFIHEELGWNLRMTNMQAAIGLAQTERLDYFLTKKKAIGARYQELFDGVENIQLPIHKTEYAENNYWVFGVVLNDSLGANASIVMEALAKSDIGTRPFFWPMHKQPVLKRLGLFEGQSFPVSERIARQGFYLPSGIALNLTDCEVVASKLIKILKTI